MAERNDVAIVAGCVEDVVKVITWRWISKSKYDIIVMSICRSNVEVVGKLLTDYVAEAGGHVTPEAKEGRGWLLHM